MNTGAETKPTRDEVLSWLALKGAEREALYRRADAVRRERRGDEIFVRGIVRRIKAGTGLAITVSVGNRSREVYAYWRDCGMDRYLERCQRSDSPPTRNPEPGTRNPKRNNDGP